MSIGRQSHWVLHPVDGSKVDSLPGRLGKDDLLRITVTEYPSRTNSKSDRVYFVGRPHSN